MNLFKKLTQHSPLDDEKAQSLEAQKRSDMIMQRGGPQSLEDYLLLFPGACPKCGYREVVDCLRQWGGNVHGEPAIISESWRECTRCHHRGDITTSHRYVSREDAENVDSSIAKTHNRVASPYLTQEQSGAIPELPLA